VAASGSEQGLIVLALTHLLVDRNPVDLFGFFKDMSCHKNGVTFGTPCRLGLSAP